MRPLSRLVCVRTTSRGCKHTFRSLSASTKPRCCSFRFVFNALFIVWVCCALLSRGGGGGGSLNHLELGKSLRVTAHTLTEKTGSAKNNYHQITTTVVITFFFFSFCLFFPFFLCFFFVSLLNVIRKHNQATAVNVRNLFVTVTCQG